MRQHRVREEEGFFFQEIDNEKLNTKDFSLHLINMGKRRLPAKKKLAVTMKGRRSLLVRTSLSLLGL